MRQLGQHVGDVEDARLQALLARERQELAHEVRGAVGVLLDLHDVGEGRIARPEAQQQKIAEADHRGQQIVEVVRHAAGELAHRLHLLRLGELRLEALLIGGVDEMQDEAGIARAEAADEHGGAAGARTAQPDLDRRRGRAPFAGVVEACGDERALGRIDEADEVLADELAMPEPEQLAQRAVRLLEPAVAADERDADRSVGEKAAIALARQAQLPLRARARARGRARSSACASRRRRAPRFA